MLSVDEFVADDGGLDAAFLSTAEDCGGAGDDLNDALPALRDRSVTTCSGSGNFLTCCFFR